MFGSKINGPKKFKLVYMTQCISTTRDPVNERDVFRTVYLWVIIVLNPFLVVFLSQSAIKSKGYRSLVEGEKVQFQIVNTDKGKIAIFVTSPGGGNLGRKSRVKKGARKFTSLCYNCNENGHRMKKCPYEKRDLRTCHKCGAKSHLIRTCPKLLEDNDSRIQQDINEDI